MPQRPQHHPALTQSLDGAHDPGQGPAEPVEGDDDHGVTVAGVVQQCDQSGAVVAGAADLVGEDPIAAGGRESVGLLIEGLVACSPTRPRRSRGCAVTIAAVKIRYRRHASR
jgi:hypothetical protein